VAGVNAKAPTPIRNTDAFGTKTRQNNGADGSAEEWLPSFTAPL
jgi:hypothetical protein